MAQPSAWPPRVDFFLWREMETEQGQGKLILLKKTPFYANLTLLSPSQAVLPCGWSIPGWHPASGVRPLPAPHRPPGSEALWVLAAIKADLREEQSSQHFPTYHPVPVLYGKPELLFLPPLCMHAWAAPVRLRLEMLHTSFSCCRREFRGYDKKCLGLVRR